MGTGEPISPLRSGDPLGRCGYSPEGVACLVVGPLTDVGLAAGVRSLGRGISAVAWWAAYSYVASCRGCGGGPAGVCGWPWAMNWANYYRMSYGIPPA